MDTNKKLIPPSRHLMKPRKFRIRFGLGFLLTMFGLTAIVCAIVGSRYSKYRDDLEIVQQLGLTIEDGPLQWGTEGYRFEHEDLGPPNALRNLRKLFQFYPRVKIVSISSMNDEKFELVAKLSELESLTFIDHAELTTLDPVAKLQKLETFVMSPDYGVDNYTIQNLNGFRGLPNLRKVELAKCEGISNLEGLSHCEKLESIYIDSCSELESLAGLESLPSLAHFTCTENWIQSFSRLASFTKLQTLDVRDSLQLNDLSFLRSLTRLKDLSLENCSGVEDFSSLSALKLLTRLDLRGSNVQNVDFLSEAHGLQVLKLRNCRRLQNVDSVSPQNGIEKLDFETCHSLQRFDFSRFNELTNTKFVRCLVLEEIKNLQQHWGITEIVLKDCYRLDEFDWLSNCPNLVSLSTNAAVPLSILKQFRNLESILIFRCDEIEVVEQLIGHRNLEFLMIADCPNLVGLEGIGKLENLKRLRVADCPRLSRIDDIGESTSISSVRFQNCESLVNLEALTKVPTITDFDFRDCPRIANVGDLESDGTIRLYVRNSPGEKIKHIRPIKVKQGYMSIADNDEIRTLDECDLSGLYRLTLQNLPELSNLDCLARVPELTSLVILGCPKIQSLPEGWDTSCLSNLCINDCQSFESLPKFERESGANLRTLSIVNCPLLEQRMDWARFSSLHRLDMSGKFADANLLHISDQPIVGKPNHLKRELSQINISSCSLPELTNLELFSIFPELFLVYLNDCKHVVDLKGLTKMGNPRLTIIGVTNCPSFKSAEGTEEFPNIEYFKVRDCPQFTELGGIESCVNLRSVRLSNCERLGNLGPLLDSDLDQVSNLEIGVDSEQAIYKILKKHLPKLEALSLSNLRNCDSIGKLKLGTKLQELTLVNCDGIQNLDFLLQENRLNTFAFVKVLNAPNLTSIAAMEDILADDLILEGCPNIDQEDVNQVKRDWPKSWASKLTSER